MFHFKLGIVFALSAYLFVYIHSEGIGSSCFYEEDCGNKEGNFKCENGICRCENNYIPDRDNKICVVDILKPCKRYDKCYDQHAECIGADGFKHGRCECNKGYTLHHQKMVCSVVIGNNCTKSDDCIEGICKTVIPSQNGTSNYTQCFCNEPLQSNKNGTKCLPAVNADCSQFNECAKENSICNNNKQCICVENYKEAVRNNETYCLAMLNNTCFNASDCADIGTDCIDLNKTETKNLYSCNPRKYYWSNCPKKEVPKFCVCGQGYVRHPNASECLKVATKFNDTCVRDIQCSLYSGIGSQCTNNFCECKKGFYFDVDFNRCVRSCLCNDHNELKTILKDLVPVLKKVADNYNIEISETLEKINKLS